MGGARIRGGSSTEPWPPRRGRRAEERCRRGPARRRREEGRRAGEGARHPAGARGSRRAPTPTPTPSDAAEGLPPTPRCCCRSTPSRAPWAGPRRRLRASTGGAAARAPLPRCARSLFAPRARPPPGGGAGSERREHRAAMASAAVGPSAGGEGRRRQEGAGEGAACLREPGGSGRERGRTGRGERERVPKGVK